MGLNKQKKRYTFFGAVVIGLVACLLYGVSAAIRGNIGILLNPLEMSSGLSYEQVSFCIALMNLLFGVAQPFFGMMAARSSNRMVLTTGLGLLVIGLFGMLNAHSYPALVLSLGILFGIGSGAIAFGMVLTSAIHFAGKEHAMTLSGLLNAAAGMISFILAPLMQTSLNHLGLIPTLFLLAALIVAMIPVVFFITSRDPNRAFKMRKKGPAESEKAVENLNGFALLKHAFSNRTYLFLIGGFSTCGFHMVIIESHLFSQYTTYGIPKTAASWAFSFYGVATIAGALLSGYLSTRLHKGHLLGFYYGFRAIWVLTYLFVMPKNIATAFLFSIGLGLTGDATVSPTSGLVNQNFHIDQVATLIGFLFLCHQIGAFFSAWLGGITFQITGSYNTIWIMDMALCTFASLISLRIKEK